MPNGEPSEYVFRDKLGYGTVAAREDNKLEIDFDGGDRKRVIDSFVRAE
jgi:DNA helicase II / ATP-dependent DNA helicase PcrA